MPEINPVSKRDYLVKIGEIASQWNSASGGEETVETSTYDDPFDNDKRTVTGANSVSELTLSRPYDPDLDSEVVRTLRDYKEARRRFTVVVQPARLQDGKLVARSGNKITYLLCIITSLSYGEADRASADVDMIKVTIKPTTKTLS
jgi:hypothetical protein